MKNGIRLVRGMYIMGRLICVSLEVSDLPGVLLFCDGKYIAMVLLNRSIKSVCIAPCVTTESTALDM